MEKNIIKLIDTDDTEVEVEVISILKDDINRKYLIYTKGEKQTNGNIIVYISKLGIKEDKYYLENIYDESEWNDLKLLMGDIINN